MNHITIEFCKEDRQRIDELIGLAAWITGALKDLAAAQTVEAPEPVNEHPVDKVSPHAAPEPEVAPAATQHTLDDVRAVVQRLIGPGSTKREAAKAIVEEYAPKLSGIPVDKYDEIMGRLIKLEKEAS